MQKKLNWTAYSSETRLEIVEKIKDTISSNHGYIINFNMFSDLSLVLSIEITENKIPVLHDALKTILKISDLESSNEFRSSKQDWLIFLNISFSKGKGKLRVEIPSVPG